MADDPRTIQVDQFLAHPPARVWRALTDPARIATWLMPNDFALRLGHRFTMRTHPVPAAGFDGVVHCEVLAFEVERLLRIGWAGGAVVSTVTWRLEPEGRGTRLFLEHAGFDPDDPVQQLTRTILGGGWRTRIWRSLESCLQAETP